MSDIDSEWERKLEWQRKGATLSEKTVEKEFGLRREQILKAIRAGKLQYREGSMHGNPWLRLLRREVQALVTEDCGADYVKTKQLQTELANVNRQLKNMRTQAVLLEKRRAELVAALSPSASRTGRPKGSSRQ